MHVIDPVEKFIHSASIQIESVNAAKKLYGNQISPDFLIFDYLRDDEMGLSRCIGNLLDPNGKHSQGTSFLDLFIAYIHRAIDEQTKNDIAEGIISSANINHQFDWREIDSQNCKVKLELSTDTFRRIDIHLQFDSGHVIGIENKPWAGDQNNQLSDYANYLKRQSINNEWLLIYLSNSEPDEHSIPTQERVQLESQGRLLTINYDSLINWLQNCINVTKSPVVRVFIEELLCIPVILSSYSTMLSSHSSTNEQL